MHNDPVNLRDLWGLRQVEGINPNKNEVFNPDELSDERKIQISIYKIAGTSYGKTDEGKALVTDLLEMNKDGRIGIKELGDNTRAEEYWGVYLGIRIAKPKIYIDVDEPYRSYPGRLTHEGTHLEDDIKGLPYTLSSERRAYDAASIVDDALGYPTNNPTDQQLQQRYSKLTDDISKKETEIKNKECRND